MGPMSYPDYSSQNSPARCRVVSTSTTALPYRELSKIGLLNSKMYLPFQLKLNKIKQNCNTNQRIHFKDFAPKGSAEQRHPGMLLKRCSGWRRGGIQLVSQSCGSATLLFVIANPASKQDEIHDRASSNFQSGEGNPRREDIPGFTFNQMNACWRAASQHQALPPTYCMHV